MIKKILVYTVLFLAGLGTAKAQINTEQVIAIGRNSLYFEDYVLAIQYFNQVIRIKPYLAEPYFFRALAKLYLDDYKGAEEDCNEAIERNPYVTNVFQLRGLARQQRGDFEGAVADYRKGLESAPEERILLLNKAICEIQLKRYDEAEGSFDELMRVHPAFYNGYLARSQFYLERGDTIAALRDVDKAISLDRYSSYGYAQRAILRALYEKDYDAALVDMDEAVRLDPAETSYYINRGLIRYYKNDLRGTMDDYDRVLSLDPRHTLAHYNRGLLRAQVGDKNRAIEDFSAVLAGEPDNYFAYYNRALLRFETGDYSGAVRDYDAVLAEYPHFIPGYYARSEAKQRMRDLRGGEADFKKAMQLQEAYKAGKLTADEAGQAVADAPQDETEKTRKESEKNIRRFRQLMVADASEVKPKYDSPIRGRVQDKQVNATLEPSFILTYYQRVGELERPVYFLRNIDEINRSAFLKRALLITNAEGALTASQVTDHFRSIDDYSLQISRDPGNMSLYFARALDYMLVQDLRSASADLDRVIELSPTFAPAYFCRAAIRFRELEYQMANESGLVVGERSHAPLSISLAPMTAPVAPVAGNNSGLRPESANESSRTLQYDWILRDYEKAVQLDPQFVYAYFNRGNVQCTRKNYNEAIADYSEAIRIYPDFSEAYLNRGLVYLLQGKTQQGVADLSKAGELGLFRAYSLLKRLQH